MVNFNGIIKLLQKKNGWGMPNLNFRISEFIKSDIARVHHINNMPDANDLDNILNLIVHCLQPIRNKIKKPIIITSGYRCPAVNRWAGGKPNSQHQSGQAADFVINGIEPSEIINKIKGYGVEYDQLINEYNKWVHISYVKGKNRGQCFSIN